MVNAIAKGNFSNFTSFKEFLKRNIGCSYIIKWPANYLGRADGENRVLTRVRTRDGISTRPNGGLSYFELTRASDWDFSEHDKRVAIYKMNGEERFRMIF